MNLNLDQNALSFSNPKHILGTRYPVKEPLSEVSNLRTTQNDKATNTRKQCTASESRLKQSTNWPESEGKLNSHNAISKLHNEKQTSAIIQTKVVKSLERMYVTPRRKLLFSLSSSDSEDDIFSQKMTPTSSTVRTPNLLKEDAKFTTPLGVFCTSEIKDVPLIDLCTSDEDLTNTARHIQTCSNFSKYSGIFSKDFNLKELNKNDVNLFLASLTENRSAGILQHIVDTYTLHYAQNKDSLVKNLYLLFNKYVFGGKLPDDMKISWKSRLTSTAGYCRCSSVPIRQCSIELSPRLLNTAGKLRDTLIHELCHAAVFLITKEFDSHGSFWRYWTTKASVVFSSLPPITRCHSYK